MEHEVSPFHEAQLGQLWESELTDARDASIGWGKCTDTPNPLWRLS